jgi:hypothetical protein
MADKRGAKPVNSASRTFGKTDFTNPKIAMVQYRVSDRFFQCKAIAQNNGIKLHS